MTIFYLVGNTDFTVKFPEIGINPNPHIKKYETELSPLFNADCCNKFDNIKYYVEWTFFF